MKNLLTTFVIILLIASCSSPTENDNEFKPYIVGSYKITSPTSAEYVGVQKKNMASTSSTDTIVIDQPGKRSLELIRDNNDDIGKFSFVFQDSTVSSNGNGSNISEIKIVFPNSETNINAISSSGYRVNINQDRLKAELYASYDCQTVIGNTSVILLQSYNYDGTHFRSWKILSDSLDGAIKDIAC